MPQPIDPRFASPNLRWSLCLKDHPGATYRFELRSGAQLHETDDLPAEFGGSDERKFCVCTITFPKHPDEVKQREPAVGWKSITAKELKEGDPEVWTVLCTKTLGRALKRAGYPDMLPDLKALLLWYQRLAEIDRVREGHEPIGELGAGQKAMDDAVDAAGQKAGDDGDPDVIDLESEEGPSGAAPRASAQPDGDGKSELEKRIRALGPTDRSKVLAFMAERAIKSYGGRVLESFVKSLEAAAEKQRADEAPWTGEGGEGDTAGGNGKSAAPAAQGMAEASMVEAVLAVTADWTPEIQSEFAGRLEAVGAPPLGPWSLEQLNQAEALLDEFDKRVQAGASK
jgi:hypothetical protein